VEQVSSRVVLRWLERELGPYRGGGVAKPEWDAQFSVLQFQDRPTDGVTVSVTFGIGAHVLVGADGVGRRQELLVALREAFAETAITLVAGVGSYLLDDHLALVEGETIRAPHELGVEMMLVAARPDAVAPRLVRFDEVEPPLELAWLLPFHEIEYHVVVGHGWPDLLALLAERGLDPFDLERRAVVGR
jgi:Suppressor of fused protein (SUFU)